MARWLTLTGAALLLLATMAPASAQEREAAPTLPLTDTTPDAPASSAKGDTRNGKEIFDAFRAGLADKNCNDGVSSRWSKHFAGAPMRLAKDDDLLPMFGYVVDALRAASLPTEYALIPFVESGYKPGARSPSGPAGLWQMIKLTARNHRIAITPSYDGRLSPVDSTRAAVRYLKTLHGMFAGDWRLASMAYNTGEYRVFGALRRGGQQARSADPALLALPGVTQAYVRKLHALSCLMTQAEGREEWLDALDRPVPRLEAVEVPSDVDRIATFASRTGQDAARLQRLNPAYVNGRIPRGGAGPARLLAVAGGSERAADGTTMGLAASGDADLGTGTGAGVAEAGEAIPGEATIRYSVAPGDTASAIAQRHGIRLSDLLRRNGLRMDSVLRPGQTLAIAGAAD